MIHAVISDVHANAIALSAVLSDARSCGAESIISLGDVVGYGPEPEQTVSMARRTTSVSLAGNHDDAVAGRLDPSGFIDLAADAVARHREALSRESIEWLRGLPYVYGRRGFACAHGDFTSPESFEYVTDEDSAKANFLARQEQLLFVGHSHVPQIFLVGASGNVYSLPPTDFMLEDGKRYIVNPGSVGYPRTDGSTCESTYVLYDDTERTVTFRRLPFTVRSVMQTGRNPKRLKRRTVISIALAAAAASGAAAWLLSPDERVETVTEVVTNNVEKVVERTVATVVPIGHIDRRAECGIPPGMKKVDVHVKLSKGSPAAQMQLVFQDAEGNTLGDERWTARKSRKMSVKVPPAAVKAILSAGRASGDEPASFSEFSLAPWRP